jgi:hypothetical protein
MIRRRIVQFGGHVNLSRRSSPHPCSLPSGEGETVSRFFRRLSAFGVNPALEVHALAQSIGTYETLRNEY